MPLLVSKLLLTRNKGRAHPRPRSLSRGRWHPSQKRHFEQGEPILPPFEPSRPCRGIGGVQILEGMVRSSTSHRVYHYKALIPRDREGVPTLATLWCQRIVEVGTRTTQESARQVRHGVLGSIPRGLRLSPSIFCWNKEGCSFSN
ncbi:hypothetical protein SLA2020_277000 [Shorea laevis]